MDLRDTMNKDQLKVGAGIAALALVSYFFLSPNAKKHQRNLKGWMIRMRGEVIEKLEEVKEVSQPVYNEIVDTVAHANAVANKIPQAEILALATDLKRQWKTITSKKKSPKKARRKSSPRRKK